MSEAGSAWKRLIGHRKVNFFDFFSQNKKFIY